MPDHNHGLIFIRGEKVGARPEETAKSFMSSIASPVPVKLIFICGEKVGARPEESAKSLMSLIASPVPVKLIFIRGEKVGARLEETTKSLMSSIASPVPVMRRKLSLGEIVGAYKSTVARLYNRLSKTPGRSLWQRNYYEHVIRDDMDLDQIRCYIQDNPSRWEDENADRYPW